jgi:hypothetical protein
MMSKEAMKRISDNLKKAGATLPAPEITGTIEGSMITGLCIALAIVEQEIEALAEQPAQQEPVAWRVRFHYGTDGMEKRIGDWKLHSYLPTPEKDKEVEPLYTSPPAQRKPLTDKQRSKMYRAAVLRGNSIMLRSDYELGIIDAEAAHGIKE